MNADDPDHESGRPVSSGQAAAHAADDRRLVTERQREAYGGIKPGSCFFGWLTATGTAVLLIGLLTAVGAGVGLANSVNPQQALQNPGTVGIAGGIVLVIIIFVAYYCGGYVAGRMARFNGIRQGLGVWLWALLIAIHHSHRWSDHR